MNGIGAVAVPPPQPIYSGVMDIQASPHTFDLTDSPAKAVRCIRNAGFNPAELRGWINTCFANDLWPIPCFHTDYADTALGRQAYAQAIQRTLKESGGISEPGFFCEMGNEPGTGDGSNTLAEQQDNRDNYLKMLFTPVDVFGVTMRAVDVVHAYGGKVLLAAITGKTGGFGNLASDIDDGNFGADWADIDAVCFHPYAQEPIDVLNTLKSNRNTVDTHGCQGKPIIVTEVGWCCAVRADGSQPSPWPGGKDDWDNQTPQWLNVDRSITRAEQADLISKGDGTGLWERIGKAGIVDPSGGAFGNPLVALKILALCWFGHQDYGLPNQDHYHHCGLFDITGVDAGAKRTAWGRLNAEARILRVDHYHRT